MPNVSKEFFLADRNHSNWTLTVTEPVEEEEVATIVATNKITGTEFEGTVTDFNAYLAVPLGTEHKPADVYDLTTGALSSGGSRINAVLFEHNPVTGDVNKIYRCTEVEYAALTPDADTLYVVIGVGIYMGSQLVVNQVV